MMREPGHRLLDLRDPRLALLEPAGAEAGELDLAGGVGDVPDHPHDVDPVAQPEQRAAIRALVLGEAIDHERARVRQQRADQAAGAADRQLLLLGEARQLLVDALGVLDDRGERRARRAVAETRGLALAVSLGAVLGLEQLAEQGLQQLLLVLLLGLVHATWCSKPLASRART